MKEQLITTENFRGIWEIIPTTITSRSKHSLNYVDGVNNDPGLLLLGGQLGNGAYITNSFYFYSIKNNQWISKTFSFGNIAYHSSVSDNNKLYIYGGHNGSAPINTLRVYDHITSTWSTLADGPGARWTTSLCKLDNNLYMFGGLIQGTVRVKDFYQYSIDNDSWLPLSEGPSERNGATLISLDNKIYLYGGFTQSILGNSNELWQYDPANNSRQLYDTLPFGLGTPKMYSFNNSLLIYGSNSDTNNVLIKYNVLSKESVLMEPGLSDRIYFGMAGINNTLYIQGGIKNTTAYSNMGIFTY